MSDNALVSPKSENRKLNNSEDIEFLEKLQVPDLRFEEFCVKNGNLAKWLGRMKKSRIK